MSHQNVVFKVSSSSGFRRFSLSSGSFSFDELQQRLASIASCPSSLFHCPPPFIQRAAAAGVLHLLEFARERDALFLQASTSEVQPTTATRLLLPCKGSSATLVLTLAHYRCTVTLTCTLSQRRTGVTSAALAFERVMTRASVSGKRFASSSTASTARACVSFEYSTHTGLTCGRPL